MSILVVLLALGLLIVKRRERWRGRRECKGTEAKQTGGTAFLVLTFICYTAYRLGLLAV